MPAFRYHKILLYMIKLGNDVMTINDKVLVWGNYCATSLRQVRSMTSSLLIADAFRDSLFLAAILSDLKREVKYIQSAVNQESVERVKVAWGQSGVSREGEVRVLISRVSREGDVSVGTIRGQLIGRRGTRTIAPLVPLINTNAD